MRLEQKTEYNHDKNSARDYTDHLEYVDFVCACQENFMAFALIVGLISFVIITFSNL